MGAWPEGGVGRGGVVYVGVRQAYARGGGSTSPRAEPQPSAAYSQFKVEHGSSVHQQRPVEG